jgi:uncharacterized protein (DUF2336 family)
MSSPHSGIQGLVELARRDRVELRPVLLRVLTDLYVQEAVHGPAEKARYAELACRLLDSVDLATRAAVAERLARYAGTPPAVAGKLARDDISAAGPILRRSSVLSEAELHSILDSRGIAHAVAIAARENLPRSIAARLREAGTGRTQKDVPGDQARMTNRTSTQAMNSAVTFTLARRFLVTNADERRRILTALACCPPVDDEERLRRLDRGLNDELERAALRHRSTEFMTLLHDHAGMPGDIAARIVSETSGEPLAVVCRALDMPFNTASRILLFLNPAIGGSVQRVFRLASRYEEAKPENARRLTAAWCGLGAGLSAPRREWTRPARARNDPRSAARRAIRGVTPARPAAANES